jgi:hypothetical protein
VPSCDRRSLLTCPNILKGAAALDMRKRIRQRLRYSLFSFSVNLLHIVTSPYRLSHTVEPAFSCVLILAGGSGIANGPIYVRSDDL